MNDKLILELWSMSIRGARTFEAEGHQIEFRVAIGVRGAQGDAYVDGKPVATDLFAEFNDRINPARVGKPRSPMSVVYEIGWWVLLVLFLMLLFK